MGLPIYSNNPPKDGYDSELEKHFILLLSDTTIDEINTKLTFVKHGIYLFIQYKEKGYIVNNYPEEVFWNIVNGLYQLIHDCSNEMIKMFLQIVDKNGFGAINQPFNITDNSSIQKFESAMEFIKDIENMRIIHYHNMKPDSEGDKSRVRKVEKKFWEILRSTTVPHTDKEWECCIAWIYKNCKRIYELLEERLTFLQEEATQAQQQYLCEKYYDCLQKYYERSMFEIIKEVLRKKRIKRDSAQIQSLINVHKNDIVKKAIMLIKSATDRTDPYQAVIQATDTIFNEKKEI